MRTESVILTRTCNLACTFCDARRPADDPAEIAHPAVRRRILAAAGDELVLTGGEPTRRRDLDALVRAAKAAGARTVILETNATLIDDERARSLRDAGIDVARVHVPALGAALDDLTRDVGAGAALERGLRALAAAGIALDVALPLVRSTLAGASLLPVALVALVPVRTLILRVPTRSPVESELVSYGEAQSVIRDVVEASRRVGLATKLAPDSGPPPCVFPAAERPAHLYALSGRPPERDDRVHVDACTGCRVRSECAGFDRAYLERLGIPAMEPILHDRARRRLALVSTVEEQIARELVSPGGRPRHDGDPEETIVRVNFQCNQACEFCFVSTHLPAAAPDAVIVAIEQALAARRRIVLSGGEPTLNPRLPDYLRLASTSPWPVQLQTNAVLLDDAALARELVESGLRFAFVSLHGATARTSDAVTRARDTFVRTLGGLDRLHALAVTLELNFVICRSNAAELPDVVALIAERWPGAALSVSFVARSTDVVPRDPEFLPRYTDVMPFIAEALERGRARGVRVDGFGSMCGLPLCLVPVPSAQHLTLPELPPDVGDGEFHKPAPCDGCALSTRCFGLRRGYAEVHGTGELSPVMKT